MENEGLLDRKGSVEASISIIQIADVRHHSTSIEPAAKMDTESPTYCQCADYFERSEARDEHRELVSHGGLSCRWTLDKSQRA